MNQQQVIQDVKHWITEFVTKPNPLLNKLPPCPYAKQAMIEDKVQIVVPTEGTVSYAIQHALTNFDPNMVMKRTFTKPTDASRTRICAENARESGHGSTNSLFVRHGIH